jgi:hypothetical protein
VDGRDRPGHNDEFGETPVAMSLAEAREQLARANRMIANEGMFDRTGSC